MLRLLMAVNALAGTFFTALGAYYSASQYYGWKPDSGGPMSTLSDVFKQWQVAFLVIGVVLIVLSGLQALGVIGGSKLSDNSTVTGSTDTDVKLQFNQGNVLPTSIALQNIWRWYAFAYVVNSIDAKGTVTQLGKAWTVFLLFDKPINLKQIAINAGGAVLPPNEVKDSGPRHAIIFFSGDLSGMVLDIKAQN